jgi:hypothetical protein
MLHLDDYGDFADYFGPRWHFYLGNIIASIPVPFVFAADYFQTGIAAKVLRLFAEDPLPYLDETMKRRITAVQSGLLRKFTDIAFDGSAKVRWQESQRAAADDVYRRAGTDENVQNDLFAAMRREPRNSG